MGKFNSTVGKVQKRKRKVASKFDLYTKTWKPCLNLNAKEPWNFHRNRNTENKKVIFLYWVNLYSTFVFRLFMGIAWSGYKLGEHILSKNYNFFFFFFAWVFIKHYEIFVGIYELLYFMSEKKKMFFFMTKLHFFNATKWDTL